MGYLINKILIVLLLSLLVGINFVVGILFQYRILFNVLAIFNGYIIIMIVATLLFPSRPHSYYPISYYTYTK